jgi:3-methyladenine DNA glycosylase AlkD
MLEVCMEKTDKEQLRDNLTELADEKYRLFMSSLLPGIDNILGVRMPALHKLAREIARGDWRVFLERPGDNACYEETKHQPGDKGCFGDKMPRREDNLYFEEIMLRGLVIGYAKADITERLRYVESFVPEVNNWAICDSFCGGLKFTVNNKERVWNFLQPYFASNKEYRLRFGIVMLLNFYIEDQYIDRVLKVLDGVNHDGYYVKMAAAWAISICYVKQPDKTMEYLKSSNLDDFTYNKALQKIIESNRVGKETKDLIHSMKRKSTY